MPRTRTFIDGSGADSTAAAIAYLKSHRELTLPDLYIINTADNVLYNYLGKTFLLTDYPSPLTWDYKGQFLPGAISRGEVSSKIGLEADKLAVTWAPQDSDVLGADGDLTALAAFGYGLFDNSTVEVWRCVMPQPGDLIGSPEEPALLGDCNSFGASLIFAGREIGRAH